jgi:hypothetical protein
LKQTFAILGAFVLGTAGCESCKNKNDTNTPSVPDATPVGPVLVAPDGGTIQVPASSVITEKQANDIGGPIGTGKLRASVPLAVDCKAGGMPVSPTIFGIAWADGDKDIGATAHRWGGNTTTRYNPKLGNAWSSARDWFYENQEIDSTDKFLGKVVEKGGVATITVPIMGWVAKDTSSCSFPKGQFAQQEKFADDRPQCGNGKKPDGKTDIKPGDPSISSVKITPEDVGAWVAKLKAADTQRGKRIIYEYILDNEPGLWSSTHRDVHPDPLTYDELLEKTIAFGTAIRKADPDAIIAGPASYGWWEYFWSTKDHDSTGFPRNAPDRRAHGDEPLLAWYLKKLAEHEKKTGVRVLDVLDVHIYPQAENVQGPDGQGGDGGGGTDRKTIDLRFRTTRSLWDREYKDESWIQDAVYLIPRMKDLIAQNYPGRGFQIGEYNFGAEHHVSGAVALAEVLGRFALFGVSHAFYWTYPKKPKPAYWAFRAFRNYDGQGGHFQDRIVPSSSPSGVSLYASRDEAGKKWVLVALNFSQDRPFDATIALNGCTAPSATKSFVYTGGETGFTNGSPKVEGSNLKASLPPLSITVVELTTP